MARKIDRLSARGVASAAPGLHADGGGLYLKVESAGARRWTFIFRHAGKRCEMGMGPAGDVSLAAARQAAQDARALVRAGRNPAEERRRQRATQSLETFGAVSDQMLADLSPQWKSQVHARQWRTTLTIDGAALRSMPVARIATEDILKVLRPIWLQKPETAARLRGRIERVLDAAKAKGLRDGDNPARWRGHLALLLPRRQNPPKHHPALPYAQMATFCRDLRAREGISVLALEFTILTVARTDATRRAHKDEFDLGAAIWTVPPARLKRKTPHRVPLSPRALEIARERVDAAGPDGFLFPGQVQRGKRGSPMMSNAAMAAILELMGRDDITVHGFRSTFKDWACDCTLFPNELSEVALHHTVGDETEQAYRRGDGLRMRVQMMEAWERFCAGESNVIALPVGFQGHVAIAG